MNLPALLAPDGREARRRSFTNRGSAARGSVGPATSTSPLGAAAWKISKPCIGELSRRSKKHSSRTVRYTLTLQARTSNVSVNWFSPVTGTKVSRICYVAAQASPTTRWTGVPELRLISRDIVPVDAGDLYERDVDHVSWRSDTLYRLLPRCQREGLVVVLVHSHPREVPDLSDTDTQTNRSCLITVWIRDGNDIPFASIVMTDTTIRGRAWYGWSKDPFALDVVRVVGERFQFHRTFSAERNSAVFARQIMAFGPALDKEPDAADSEQRRRGLAEQGIAREARNVGASAAR